jgi:hypothetical protein
MPAGGSKPGERRGGRKVGTPNKRTLFAKAIAEKAASEAAKDASVIGATFDSIAEKRRIYMILMSLVVEEQNKRTRQEKWDPKWLKDTAEAADKCLNGLLPYEHRRLATLEPAMETVIKPDGSVHVTISRADSEL